MRWLFMALAGALVLGGGGFMVYQNNKIPDHIGADGGDFAAMPSSPNAVSSQTDDTDKFVDPLPFKEDLASSVDAMLGALAQIPEITIERQTDRYIHAVYTTSTMRFKNDIELYFDEQEQVIHYRSESRVGHSDMGENREQYKLIASRYE